MKKLSYTTFIAAILLVACKNESPREVKNKEITQLVKTRPAGTVIAADSVLYDQLNNFHFTVVMKTTDASAKGTYAVEASIGPSMASSKFTMPHGAEEVVPVLKRITGTPSFIIGFYYNSDTTFYDYYQVNAVSGNIEMKYTKAYRFD